MCKVKNDRVNRRKKTHLCAGKQNRIFQNDSKHKLGLPIGRSNLHSDHLCGAVRLYTLLFDKKWLLTTGTHQRTDCMYNACDVSDIQSTFLKNINFLAMVSRHDFSLFNTYASQSGLFYELWFAIFSYVYFNNRKNCIHKIDDFVSWYPKYCYVFCSVLKCTAFVLLQKPNSIYFSTLLKWKKSDSSQQPAIFLSTEFSSRVNSFSKSIELNFLIKEGKKYIVLLPSKVFPITTF